MRYLQGLITFISNAGQDPEQRGGSNGAVSHASQSVAPSGWGRQRERYALQMPFKSQAHIRLTQTAAMNKPLRKSSQNRPSACSHSSSVPFHRLSWPLPSDCFKNGGSQTGIYHMYSCCLGPIIRTRRGVRRSRSDDNPYSASLTILNFICLETISRELSSGNWRSSTYGRANRERVLFLCYPAAPAQQALPVWPQ